MEESGLPRLAYVVSGAYRCLLVREYNEQNFFNPGHFGEWTVCFALNSDPVR